MHNIEAADLREVPKNRPMLWALDACYMGNECPLLVLSMPDTWSLSAHLMVSYRRNILNFAERVATNRGKTYAIKGK